MSTPAESPADTPAVVPTAPEAVPARALSARLWALIAALCLTSAAAAGLTARLTVPAPPRFATADLQEVFDLAQLQMTDLVTRKDASDREREQAYALASQFGPKVEAALEAIQADCRCLVLVRGAVARGRLPDYTDALKHAIGVDALDAAALKQRVARQQSQQAARSAQDLPLGFLDRLPAAREDAR